MSLAKLAFHGMNQPPASSDPRDNPSAHTSLTVAGDGPQPPADSLAGRYPWAVFILPFAVYMVANSLEPAPDKPLNLGVVSVDYASYPIVYTVEARAGRGHDAGTAARLPAVSLPRLAAGAWWSAPWAWWSGSACASCGSSRPCWDRWDWIASLGLGERAAYNPLEQLVRPAGSGLRLSGRALPGSGGRSCR